MSMRSEKDEIRERSLKEDAEYGALLKETRTWGIKMALCSGTPDLISLYYPGNEILVVNIHGGGFCFKHALDDDDYCRYINQRYCVSVLNVDFLPSTKFGYPVQLIEIETQINALLRTHKEVKKLLFVGHSSGANLALALTLRALKDERNVPSALILDYPWLDLSIRGSERPLLDGVPSNEVLDYWAETYCASSETRSTPLVSPLYLSVKEAKKLPFCVILETKRDRAKEDAVSFGKLLSLAKKKMAYLQTDNEHGFIERDMKGVYHLPNDPKVIKAKEIVDTEFALALKAIR